MCLKITLKLAVLKKKHGYEPLVDLSLVLPKKPVLGYGGAKPACDQGRLLIF